MSSQPMTATGSASIGGEPVERIGILLVHGIGEQRSFEHLENEVRNIVQAIRREVGEAEGKAIVTLQVRTTLDGAYLAQHENWRAEGVAPISIDIKYMADAKNGERRRNQRIEFREVWWADLDEPNTLVNSLSFWFWGLSLWAKPAYRIPSRRVRPNEMLRERLPGAEAMREPSRSSPMKLRERKFPRFHLFLTGVIFALILFTLVLLNWGLKKIGVNIRPVDILVRYLADVKLYQQDRRKDLWPLLDMGRPPRVMIRRRTVRAMVDIALEDAYERWYVFAHSLGTVVALNGLNETAHCLPNYLDRDRWIKCLGVLGGPARPHETVRDVRRMMPARPMWLNDDDVIYRDKLFARFRGLLTYGSPLDKFAALFPAIVNLNTEGTVFPAGAEWINVYDPTDPVAGHLDDFDPPTETWPRNAALTEIKPANYGFRASGWLLVSHIRYLRFHPKNANRLVDRVARWMLDDGAFPAPTQSDCDWLSPEPRRQNCQAWRRAGWRWIQVACVGLTAALLLAVLFGRLVREAAELAPAIAGERLLHLYRVAVARLEGLPCLPTPDDGSIVAWSLTKAGFYVVAAVAIVALAGLALRVIAWVRHDVSLRAPLPPESKIIRDPAAQP